ncbi:retrovirus-related Pol polyprotein from transposon opus [Trichonephila clavipes]|uniref:Retrovirus-related Pol polyprotein from transposon opus n=1 Tax=Trichonephila clavipes TaxID=2585209 RepID=A0A8X6SMG9_TRICX|nr:retrovirus-related Pol polyprotein from transposon opus [Trichonephila clavipes]
MAFLIRSKKIYLIQLVRDLDESPDASISKIVLRDLIISNKYYKEEEANELLEVITAERLETEQQQKLEQKEQLSIEKLRLEIELPRNANQSATQSNGQTSRVKFLDEIFKMVKRNSDDTFSQFASRLTSMWLYYCKLRRANAYESVNQLNIADKMFEILDFETVSHIGVLQGEEWYFGKQCDIFYASKGKSYDGRNVTEIKKIACFTCGSDKYFKRDCPKNKGVDNKILNVNKVSTEGTELEDGTVDARVDLLCKVIPRLALEDKLSKLVKTSINVDGKLVHALMDSGT